MATVELTQITGLVVGPGSGNDSMEPPTAGLRDVGFPASDGNPSSNAQSTYPMRGLRTAGGPLGLVHWESRGGPDKTASTISAPSGTITDIGYDGRIRLAETEDTVEVFRVADEAVALGTDGDKLVGAFPFDATDFLEKAIFRFEVILSLDDIVRTGEIFVFNLTDSEEVTDSRITLTGAGSLTPQRFTANLTPGSGVGELRLVPSVYEVRMSNDGGAGDETILGGAYMHLE